ncbi:hypothetical protein GCM10023184_01230 [Flaviaesturariibacter amylovorans]|uniref:Cbb3-type cytochrome oxidase assembly protein CcoS n=1 Tax=Flaviaesturariibacter amylovorans TaxID=1084520 RepID=A0ABP8G5N1_9BACT
MWMVILIVAVAATLILANVYLNSDYSDPADFVDQKYQEE